MLRRLSTLPGCEVRARDGAAGTLIDSYFEDEHWTVRHLVVTCGRWLWKREVLIPPLAVTWASAAARRVGVGLNRRQVRQARAARSDRPVSRQGELDIVESFGWVWSASEGIGWYGPPCPPTPIGGAGWMDFFEASRRGDPHLRSAAEVTGYQALAVDGTAGRVRDFLVEDGTWQIRSLIVETDDPIHVETATVPTRAVDRIDWLERTIYLARRREALGFEVMPWPAPPIDASRTPAVADRPTARMRVAVPPPRREE
jgi:hypothetical protein